MDINYPGSCPLMGGSDIDVTDCFRIHCVVSGEAPKWTAPEQAVETPDFQNICLACQYHRDD